MHRPGRRFKKPTPTATNEKKERTKERKKEREKGREDEEEERQRRRHIVDVDDTTVRHFISSKNFSRGINLCQLAVKLVG